MTSVTLKKKIKELVDAKSSTKSLQRIYDLLNDPVLDEGQKPLLIDRLDRAESDFRAGRTVDAPQAKKRLRNLLKDIRPSSDPDVREQA